MNKYYKLLLGILLLSMLTGLNSLAQVNDACLWMSVSLEKRVSPSFSLHVSDELRLNENITEAGTHFTEIGGEYKIMRGFSAGMYYRFMQKRRLDDSYSKRNRYYAEVNYRKKINRFTLLVRERFQSQYKDVLSSEDGKIPEYYLRSKLTVKMKILKATQFYLNSELFYSLCNRTVNQVDQLRSAAGLEYNLKQYGDLEFFYMVNKEIQVKNPSTEYIVGLGYSYTF